MYDTVLLIIVAFAIIIEEIVRIFKKSKDKKQEITIDEFDSLKEEDEKKKKAEEQLKFDSDVVDAVSSNAFVKSIDESYQKKRHSYGSSVHLDESDITRAYAASKEAEKQAKKDLYNFRLIDSVEVEKESYKEGSKISLLKEHGYNYDISLFKKWCIQLFRFIKIGEPSQFLTAKAYMTDTLSQKYETQANNFAKDNLEFITEDLVVENCYIYEFTHGVSKDELQVLIVASMKEYILNKNTGEVLRGSKDNPLEKSIIMTFEKSPSFKNEGILLNCPNCGFPLSQTDFEKCHTCQATIIPINYNWILTKFETI